MITVKIDNKDIEQALLQHFKTPQEIKEYFYTLIEKDKQFCLKNTHRWEYWKDEELDNFGKIAIGLTLNNYDDEDYSKW